MDIALLLDRLVPSAEYLGSVTGGSQQEYDDIVWIDIRAKPTWQDLLDDNAIYQKEMLSAHLADYRWQKETGGITFEGITIRTDDRSKMLLSAIQKEIDALGDPNHTRNVKTVVGFIVLTNAQLSVLYDAVVAHVQVCFDAEFNTLAFINDETLTTTAEVENAFDTEYTNAYI